MDLTIMDFILFITKVQIGDFNIREHELRVIAQPNLE